jgi:O-antigen ligase
MKGVLTKAFLLVAFLLQLAILATDKNIWRDAPTHAYGLAVFAIIDLALFGFLFMRTNRQTFLLVSAWGLIQALVMLADIFNGPSTYGTPTQFATYLFGLGYYDSNHIAFLFPALFVVTILLALSALIESRSQKGMAPEAASTPQS